MNTTGARIRQARDKIGLSQVALAKAVGVSNATISNWESDNHALKADNASKLASVLRVSVNHLLYGDKDEVELGEGFDVWDDGTPLDDDEIEVPFFKDIRLAAGIGEIAPVDDYTRRKLRFSRRTLKNFGITPECVTTATVQGTSMEPNISDGATIGIDTGDKIVKSGKIYAFRQNDMLRVKLLYHTPQGGLRIVSYNKEEYPEETLSPEAMEDIHIIGRVFWFSVMMK
jgi:phage repressor protein C with HTH and peptisase S24 domain